MSRPVTYYALYQGDELIAAGTARQIADMLGCSISQVYWYASVQARQKHMVPITKPQAIDMFAKTNTEAMAEVCSRIVRHTRGLCRDSAIGCDWLGWCEPCYRGACKLVADRKKGERSDG